MIKKLLLTGIALFFLWSARAQQPKAIDSLLQVIETTNNDSIKLRLTNQVSFYFIFNDIERAATLLNNGILEAEDKKFHFGVNELTNTKGIYFDVMGIKDSARYYFEKGLELSRKNKFKSIEQMSLNNLGMFNWNSGNFQEALDYFYQALEMNRIHSPENIQGESVYLNNIGLIYQELKQYDKALEYHQKALKIREEINLKSEQAISQANIGVCYKNLSRYEESIMSYEKAIDLAKSANSTRNFYAFHGNLASVYFELKDYQKAIELYKKSLDRPETVGANPKSDLSTYSNLVAAYKSINQPRQALNYAQIGFEIIEQNPTLRNFAATLYKNASESHYMLGDIKKGSELLAGYIAINDSVFTKDNAEALANFEVQFQTQEKEIQLADTRAALAENELKIGRKNLLIYGTSTLAFLLAILGFLFYKQQKLKNDQLQKEAELKDALNQIALQNELQEQRLNISRDLHDNIGAQLTFIISSIESIKYGLKLENVKLGDKLKTISSFTTNTIYELRDTIWAMNKSAITIEDLKLRILNFMDKAREISKNIQFDFSLDDALSNDYEFTSVEGMNIYRIIQEAVHNALKYASAKKIKIQIIKENQHIVLCIEDDGSGFEILKHPEGNGIHNMKKRTKELEAEFTIDSVPGNGTTIRVKIPETINQLTKKAS